MMMMPRKGVMCRTCCLQFICDHFVLLMDNNFITSAARLLALPVNTGCKDYHSVLICIYIMKANNLSFFFLNDMANSITMFIYLRPVPDLAVASPKIHGKADDAQTWDEFHWIIYAVVRFPIWIDHHTRLNHKNSHESTRTTEFVGAPHTVGENAYPLDA